MYIEGDATIVNSAFVSNTASARAGALYLQGQTVLVGNCNFTNNEAEVRDGGAR
jgi:hypothetical protein